MKKRPEANDLPTRLEHTDKRRAAVAKIAPVLFTELHGYKDTAASRSFELQTLAAVFAYIYADGDLEKAVTSIEEIQAGKKEALTKTEKIIITHVVNRLLASDDYKNELCNGDPEQYILTAIEYAQALFTQQR